MTKPQWHQGVRRAVWRGGLACALGALLLGVTVDAQAQCRVVGRALTQAATPIAFGPYSVTMDVTAGGSVTFDSGNTIASYTDLFGQPHNTVSDAGFWTRAGNTGNVVIVLSAGIPANWLGFEVLDLGTNGGSTANYAPTIAIGLAGGVANADFTMTVIPGFTASGRLLSYNSSTGVIGRNDTANQSPGAVGTLIGNSDANLTAMSFSSSGIISTDQVSYRYIAIPSCVRVASISQGGTAPFDYSYSNLNAPDASTLSTEILSTTSPGAPTTSSHHYARRFNRDTVLTQAPEPGFVLTSASCTDANATITGNPASFGTLSGNALTIPATNVRDEADTTCTFVNTKLPTVTTRKISRGGVGSFSFSGTNGVAAQTLTTTASDVAVSGTPQVLSNFSTATTVTEAVPPAGFQLTDISCSGLGSGGNATVDLATRSVTLDAAATAPGSDIICTFTNSGPPTVTVSKLSQGGVGTFSFSGSNGIANHNITTSTDGTAVAGAAQTLTAAGTVTTVTEAAPPAGFSLIGISCTGLGTGTATPDLATRTVTLNAAATAVGNAIACTFTNNLNQADLSVQKTTAQAAARSGDLIDFLLTINNAGPAQANGAVLRDVPGAGLDCDEAGLTALSCSAGGGASCPAAGSLTRSALFSGAGIAIPALPGGGSVVIGMQCRVTASGTT